MTIEEQMVNWKKHPTCYRRAYYFRNNAYIMKVYQDKGSLKWNGMFDGANLVRNRDTPIHAAYGLVLKVKEIIDKSVKKWLNDLVDSDYELWQKQLGDIDGT